MAHSDLKPLRWQDYLLVRILTYIEGFALSMMPRGAIRKHVLDRIDQQLKSIHVTRCGGR